jgi:hypothetical protein
MLGLRSWSDCCAWHAHSSDSDAATGAKFSGSLFLVRFVHSTLSTKIRVRSLAEFPTNENHRHCCSLYVTSNAFGLFFALFEILGRVKRLFYLKVQVINFCPLFGLVG